MRIYHKLVADRWLKAANCPRLYNTCAIIAAIRRSEDDPLAPAVNQAAADAVENRLDRWCRKRRSIVRGWMDGNGLEVRLVVRLPSKALRRPLARLLDSGSDLLPELLLRVARELPGYDETAPAWAVVTSDFVSRIASAAASMRERRPSAHGTPRAEANEIVRDYLLHNKHRWQDVTRDEVAREIGVSTGLVSATPAWRVFQRERRRNRSKHGSQTFLMGDMSNIPARD